MANGDQADHNLWTAIRTVERDLGNLARDGCGHKEWHEKVSDELRANLVAEVKARGVMGDRLFAKLDNLMIMVVGALGGIIVNLLKSYLPAIFGK
jgi:hypothetical protein